MSGLHIFNKGTQKASVSGLHISNKGTQKASVSGIKSHRINGIWMVKSPLKCRALERLGNNKHKMIEVDVSSTFQPMENLAKFW